MEGQPIEVFFSYSREDKPLRDKLEKHLSGLKRQGVISAWHDRQIVAGSEWEEEIDRHMRTADIILLLISPDFVASKYCYEIELPDAIGRHEAGEAIVVPILLRPTAGWKNLPFAKLQVYPSGGMPVTRWGDEDEAFVDVAEGIETAVKQLLKEREKEQFPTAQIRQSEKVQPESFNQVEKKGQGKSLSKPKQQSQLSLRQVIPKVLSSFEFDVVAFDMAGQEVSRSRHQANGFEENIGDGLKIDMVAILGGNFQMGSDEKSQEKPIHLVSISPFMMGKFAVTQAQYQNVMGYNPSEFKGEHRPVEQVSWEDAITFCQRLSERTGTAYRLPSEAEWEYACRAGSATPYYFGGMINIKVVNYNSDKTTDVGSFSPNLFGLYDMHGNVSEWCQDHWHKDYVSSPADGSVWASKRSNQFYVCRGGSWCDLVEGCRSAFRFKIRRGNREHNIGFRVACSLS
jgi:formylglycine-generating enzyme required for sulfatase activity